MAVAYIDLATVGEVADRNNPTGPLGGLGALPEAHAVAANERVDLGAFGFGMDEGHIRTMLEKLSDPRRRVLIVKAGTGTGKSTYMPYRLLDPPEGCYSLIENGPIVVTEPRVQATVGVAEFVGGTLSGAGGVGPGYPVGYQAGGNKQHDPACQLVFVTDGTMINWLREGRLSQIGTVIVDEAHERSTNIDFILGYLKRELPRYPHLRVIVTSATFNAEFYRQYFDAGGEPVADTMEVPAVKTIGYGWPLFPDLDVMLPEEAHLADRWVELLPQLPLRETIDVDAFVEEAWPAEAPPLKQNEVSDGSVGYVEDLRATTRALLPLRFQSEIPIGQWKTRMPEVLGRFVVQLATGLDRAGIYGDILGFLPTGKNIEEACDIIRAGIGEQADVFALLSSLPEQEKRDALEARRKGDRRKIVVSTNLAETSLTVEGVRFVVDSGLIAQSEWDPHAAQGGIRTKPHSQAGIRQRWGRVGRKSPGWVFPLYTKGQLIELSEDTDPGSTRDNLEQLIMTAKLGGIDDVVAFDWPAAFLPEPPVVLDDTALEARDKFVQELARANEALQQGGAVDVDGHPTSFGKELSRFSALGSASCAVAIMYADRLGCVPEVVTILALLHERPLTGGSALLVDRPEWPDEWRYEAATRHRALASACEDDAELVLQLTAGWERADPSVPPWDPSPARAAWARRWWVNDEVLRAAATTRRDVLGSLSPAMKEEVKRFIEPALVKRARGALSRAMAGLEYRRVDGDTFRSAVADVDDEDALGILETSSVLISVADRILPLTRRSTTVDRLQRLSNVVTFEPWALEGTGGETRPTGHRDAMRLLALSGRYARPNTAKDLLGKTIASWPAGQRMRLTFAETGESVRVATVDAIVEAFALQGEDTVAELVRAVVVDDDGDSDSASVEDAAPELDTSWPTQNPAEDDVEEIARRELVDLRDVEAAEQACGHCSACLAGDAASCERVPAGDDAEATDVLAAWRSRSTLGIDVSSPLIDLQPGTPADSEWYEIVGYRCTETSEPVVVLASDWRPSPESRDPAAHPDLKAGDPIDLVVGPLLTDHRDALRVMARADGLGRFLLREAHTARQKQDEWGQLAISLSRRYSGLLQRLTEGAQLKGTVVPRRQAGCVTVTLLELLQQHFDRGNQSLYETFDVEFHDGRTGTARFYPAVVVSEPNLNSYVDIELLVRDVTKGIVHGMAFAVGEHGDPEGAEIPQVNAPLWVRLSSERAKLPLRDVALAPLRSLANAEVSLRLPLEVQEDDEERDAEAVPTETPIDAASLHADVEVGGLDSVLLSTRPVPIRVAHALLECSEDVEWPYKVWRFWAQSRYLTSDRQDPYRAGVNVTPVDHAAELVPELPPPPILTLDEARARYPEGSTVEATVRKVADNGARAWLTLSDGTQATVVKRAVGPRGVANLRGVLTAGMTLPASVNDVGEFNDRIQVDLHLDASDVGPDEAGGRLVAAHVTVPASKISAVIGRGGDRIKRLRSIGGVTRCDLDNASATMRIEAESGDALRAVLQELAEVCEDAEGRMTVPGARHGRLIGTGGDTKRRLLRDSGCSWADPIKDTSDWAVQGPDEAAVRRFVALAAQEVPGCTAQVSRNVLIVRDVTDGDEGPIVDWRTHDWN